MMLEKHSAIRERRRSKSGSRNSTPQPMPLTPLTPFPPRNIFDSAPSPKLNSDGSIVAPWWHIAVEIIIVTMALYVVPRDLFRKGFSASNGRFVSFLASFYSCYVFRCQRPFSPYSGKAKPKNRRQRRRDSVRDKAAYHVASSLHSIWNRSRIFLACIAIKYGASTAASLILGATPVILKGPRHLLSFFTALALVQFLPGDYAYRITHHSPRLQLVMATCSSIYSFRKLMYVVNFFSGRDVWQSWLPALGVAIIAVDGGSMARRLENIVSNRGIHRRKLGNEVACALQFLWQRDAALLLFTSGLHLTSNTCYQVSLITSPPRSKAGGGVAPALWRIEDIACYLHMLAKAATLALFLYRKRVWLASRGESFIWQCVMSGGPDSTPKLQFPLRLRALSSAVKQSPAQPSLSSDGANVSTTSFSDIKNSGTKDVALSVRHDESPRMLSPDEGARYPERKISKID